MSDDSRNQTTWEQGRILSAASVVRLGLAPSGQDGVVAVLISHDCDVIESAANEPFCEILVGRKIEAPNGNFTNGKSPRRLHLVFSGGAEHLTVEFFAADKQTVRKEALLAETPDEAVRLTGDEHYTLQSWLAARYYRPIFADEFDRRLKEKPAEVHKKIANAIKNTGPDLIAVLFDIDAGKTEVHDGEDDPYSLLIILVYNVSDDPSRAQASANRAASVIKGLFRQYFFSDKKWKNIELRDCLPVSAEALSVQQLRSFKPWHFDYLEIVAGG
ncbi:MULTISPECIES: hypothetical protein [unclassified Bradyrhizobium]|uniref:hypothetical protein n=1 Tax=unclassified Bradyrhizobium TaxID=2631580 RepID=UPI0028E4B2C7|nr:MULTISPECIES: hypothetical protein [unclassified Bradyrhizobium]